MLKQDVNLYRSFKKPIEPSMFLDWNYYIVSLGIIFSFLLLSYLYSLWNLQDLKKQVAALEQTSSQLQKQMIEMKGAFPPLFFSTNAQETVANLKKELALQRKLLESTKSTYYFSANLLDFSQAIVPNVWLTKFTLDTTIGKLQLMGKSINKESLDGFIRNLANSPKYNDYDVILQNVANEAKQASSTDLTFEIDMVKKS